MNQSPQSHSVRSHEPALDKHGNKDTSIKISLTDFADFATRSGNSQFTKVKELIARGEYDPRTDFWKPLRDCIPAFHKGKRTLESVVSMLTDAKKANRYPQAIAGYKRFLAKNEPSYFTVPAWLTRLRRDVLLEVMHSAMASNSTLIPAILDVANARFISAGPLEGSLAPWLQAQAVGFVHMWNLLAAQPITIKN